MTWMIPFVVALAFYDRHGVPRIDPPLFKSVMMLVGGTVGAVLLARLMRRLVLTTAQAVWVGLWWLSCNVVLDLLVLLPLTQMSITDYVRDIGLRYLLIPIMAGAMGASTGSGSIERPQ